MEAKGSWLVSDGPIQAIEIARQVLRDGNLGIALSPSQSMILAREFLRMAGLLPKDKAGHPVGKPFERAEDVPEHESPWKDAGDS